LSNIAPKIQVFNPSAKLRLALLDLTEFAEVHSLSGKREIEKEAAIYGVRTVLGDDRLEIAYEKNGRPFLDNGVKISISHSYDKLALLFSTNHKEVGVDIEKVRDKILKIREKFLSPSELEELEGAPLEKITFYWAAKEAIYKAAGVEGLLFASEIAVHPFSFSAKGGTLAAELKRAGSEKQFTLHYQVIDDYVLVYTDNT